MEGFASFLLNGDSVRRLDHPHLLAAASDSFLSPLSANHDASEVSQENSVVHDTENSCPYRSSLLQALKQRFPNGPPEVYDEFIRVSLNDIPSEAHMAEKMIQSGPQPSTATRLSRMMSKSWTRLVGSVNLHPSLCPIILQFFVVTCYSSFSRFTFPHFSSEAY